MDDYQLDELSATIGLLRRQATTYLHGELIELYLVALDHLCPDIYQEENNLAPAHLAA